MFERKSLFLVSAAKANEEKLMEVTLDAGAEDIKQEGDAFQITAPVDAFAAVNDALTKAGIEPDAKQLTRIPTNTVEVADVEQAKAVLKMMEELDDHDDVQNVFANFVIPDEAAYA